MKERMLIGVNMVLLVLIFGVIIYFSVLRKNECGCNNNNAPVCGSDFVTYTNQCFADCAAAKLSHEGKCQVFDGPVDIPSECKQCDQICRDEEGFYLDEDNCPICECRLLPDTEGHL